MGDFIERCHPSGRGSAGFAFLELISAGDGGSARITIAKPDGCNSDGLSEFTVFLNQLRFES